MNIIKVPLREIILILWDSHPEYDLIDDRYRFHGVDHDMWEFEAIVKNVNEYNQYYSFRWFDCYNRNMTDMFNDGEMFNLTPVSKTLKMIDAYEPSIY